MMNLPPPPPDPWEALVDLPSFQAAIADPENRRRIAEMLAHPLIDPIDLRPFLRPEDIRHLKIDGTKPVFDLSNVWNEEEQ